MKTISADELRLDLDKYLIEAQNEEILITLDSGQRVWLTRVDIADILDEDLENDPRFSQIIEERRANYQKNGGLSLPEVEQELITELIEDLNHSDRQIRLEAIQHLVTLGKSIIPTLQEIGLKDIDTA